MASPLILGLAGWLAVAVAAGSPRPTSGTADRPAGRAELDVREAGAALVVQARFASGDASGALRYSLETTRAGRSRSTTRQSGRFTAEPGETASLASSQVSVSAGDRVEITLTISNEAGVVNVARTTTEVTP